MTSLRPAITSSSVSTYGVTPEQRVAWEAEVRSLDHDSMVRMGVNPTWAKLITKDEIAG